MDFNKLEVIGLAFLSGLKIAEIAEEEVIEEKECECKNKCKSKCNNTKDKVEKSKESVEEIQIKRISPDEMAHIFDTLKNKVLGGKNNE